MGDDGTTFNVRVYRTEVYKGAEVTTATGCAGRWAPGCGRKASRNAAQADSFRSALTDRCPQGRVVQPGHRQADGLGAGQGRHQLV